ncbi:hypothetical protein AQUCO_02500045v1 [Aquilegia coerulea]|uniref:Uncharacterized protein n=1 Tax=Aquilegia coerulea TaxID=218851 RepID=A0A2G5D957_AQUCA|nr:hypothetical protein AQUCO_02500045v1 [Aquilegia coerulea]
MRFKGFTVEETVLQEPVEANDSNKGHNSSKDAMILSDLLSLEIKWSAESEKNKNDIAKKVPNLNNNPLNVAGVDLDNFFSETNKDSVPYTSGQHEIPNKEAFASPGQGSLSLFENIQSTDKLVRSAEGATDDLSGWEAEFQSAGAGTLPVDSIPLNLFPDASPIDFSSTSEAPFSSEGEIKFQFDGVDSNLKENNPTVSQASMNDNWFQDDQWHTSNIESSTKIAQPETKTEAIKEGKSTESSNNLSSMDDTLFSDDIWLTSSEKPRDNEESVDAWQDFTSSGNIPDPFPSVSSLTNNTKTSTIGLAPDMNLFNGSSNDQDTDFGSFMAPDIFSGTTGLHNGLTTLNNMQEGSYTDRVEVKPGEHKSVEDMDGTFDGAMWSESADNTVERLMSEMHYLSFMLDSNLSIPQKRDAV